MIRGFGYREPSRVFNVDLFTYQQVENLYINQSRNMFVREDYSDVIDRIL